MAHTKKHTHRTAQKHAEHQDATDIQKKTIFRIFRIFIYYLWFLKWFLKEIMSYRLGTVNDFHLGFKPVLRYSKPYTSFWRRKRKHVHLLSLKYISYSLCLLTFNFLRVLNFFSSSTVSLRWFFDTLDLSWNKWNRSQYMYYNSIVENQGFCSYIFLVPMDYGLSAIYT